jgi:hypothetical protein
MNWFVWCYNFLTSLYLRDISSLKFTAVYDIFMKAKLVLQFYFTDILL